MTDFQRRRGVQGAACTLVTLSTAVAFLFWNGVTLPRPGLNRFVISVPPREKEILCIVEIFIGKTIPGDPCNQMFFTGTVDAASSNGAEVLTISNLGMLMQTEMACTLTGRPMTFVTVQGMPLIRPYGSSRPIVVFASEGVEVKYRVWEVITEFRTSGAHDVVTLPEEYSANSTAAGRFNAKADEVKTEAEPLKRESVSSTMSASAFEAASKTVTRRLLAASKEGQGSRADLESRVSASVGSYLGGTPHFVGNSKRRLSETSEPFLGSFQASSKLEPVLTYASGESADAGTQASFAVSSGGALAAEVEKRFPEPEDVMQQGRSMQSPLTRHIVEMPPLQKEQRFRIEVTVGKTMKEHPTKFLRFSGQLDAAWSNGHSYYVLRSVGELSQTKSAPLPYAPPVSRFVPIEGMPLRIPYGSQQPIICFLPSGVEVRYQVWRAVTDLQDVLA